MNEKASGAVVPVESRDSGNGQALEIRSALDIKPSIFKAGLERRKTNRETLIEWLKTALVEGTDFGRIHVVKRDQCDKGKFCDNPYHFSKPSLWKSGAEKIVGYLGLIVRWPRLADVEERIINGDPVAQLMLRCELQNSAGAVLAEGVGARALETDYGDLNKALKMTKKSGQIDAVLNCGGLSEIFTQDLEDMDPTRLETGARDPYQPGEDRIDSAVPRNQKPLSTHCPIGKDWKGVPWEEVEDGFLFWILEKIDDKPDLVERVRKEIESRSVESQEADHTRRDARMTTPTKKVSDYAREITQATNLDQLLVIREGLPTEFEPALRAFLAERETELGPDPQTSA